MNRRAINTIVCISLCITNGNYCGPEINSHQNSHTIDATSLENHNHNKPTTDIIHTLSDGSSYQKFEPLEKNNWLTQISRTADITTKTYAQRQDHIQKETIDNQSGTTIITFEDGSKIIKNTDEPQIINGKSGSQAELYNQNHKKTTTIPEQSLDLNNKQDQNNSLNLSQATDLKNFEINTTNHEQEIKLVESITTTKDIPDLQLDFSKNTPQQTFDDGSTIQYKNTKIIITTSPGNYIMFDPKNPNEITKVNNFSHIESIKQLKLPVDFKDSVAFQAFENYQLKNSLSKTVEIKEPKQETTIGLTRTELKDGTIIAVDNKTGITTTTQANGSSFVDNPQERITNTTLDNLNKSFLKNTSTVLDESYSRFHQPDLATKNFTSTVDITKKPNSHKVTIKNDQLTYNNYEVFQDPQTDLFYYKENNAPLLIKDQSTIRNAIIRNTNKNLTILQDTQTDMQALSENLQKQQQDQLHPWLKNISQTTAQYFKPQGLFVNKNNEIYQNFKKEVENSIKKSTNIGETLENLKRTHNNDPLKLNIIENAQNNKSLLIKNIENQFINQTDPNEIIEIIKQSKEMQPIAKKLESAQNKFNEILNNTDVNLKEQIETKLNDEYKNLIKNETDPNIKNLMMKLYFKNIEKLNWNNNNIKTSPIIDFRKISNNF